VAVFTKAEQESPRLAETIRQRLRGFDTDRVAICLPGCGSYGDICRLAEALKAALGEKPIIAALQTDCAKALGHCLRLLLPNRPCLCLDGLSLEPGSYLDVGEPVGPAFAVVIKTFVLAGGNQ
jgi:ethanolamine utilization protein EutA (predicted chaperonin)